MKKEQVIKLMDIGRELKLKLDQSHQLIEIGYWDDDNKGSIEQLLMDIFGIPKGTDRDDYFGLFEVYNGVITPEYFIRKAELISDHLIKPTADEIVQRLVTFSKHLQERVKVLEKVLDAKIYLIDDIISELDGFIKNLKEYEEEK